MAVRSWVQRSRRDTNPMRFLIPATRPDRFRGYATRVVRTTVRDATYVLGTTMRAVASQAPRRHVALRRLGELLRVDMGGLPHTG
jgi:hypothetical protein